MTFNPNPANPLPYAVQTEDYYSWWDGDYRGSPYYVAPMGNVTIISIDGNIILYANTYIYLGVTIAYRTIRLENGSWVASGFPNQLAQWQIDNFKAHPEWMIFPPNIDGHEVPEGQTGTGGGYKEYNYTNHITLTKPIGVINLLKPQIKDYFTGYSLDSVPYKINLDLAITPPKDGIVKLHYYYLEDEIQVDSDGTKHPTVNVGTLRLECDRNRPCLIKLTGIPCSISLEGDSELCDFIKTEISSSHPRCFPEDLSTVKSYWESLYTAHKAQVISSLTVLSTIALTTTPYVWAATPRWGQLPISDLNTGQGVGENVRDSFVYGKYFEPQSDGTFGSYIMPDSAIVKAIGFALDVETWGVNPDDPSIPRVDNLGWRIKRSNEVLGIRVKSDGTIDETLEKTENRRLHADGSTANDVQEYNPNCFGSKGMLVRHMPNKFSPSGTVAGGYRKVKDIPQYMAELHEQANAAMGYQEGTAIEIQLDGKTYRYPNQLALMTELFVTAKQTATYSKGAFFSSLVSEQSIKEVMAGLGLRTVDKYLEFNIAGKTAKLYYKGISASQSIRRKLSAVTTNIGMVLGNII
jgi:hypothetical protein